SKPVETSAELLAARARRRRRAKDGRAVEALVEKVAQAVVVGFELVRRHHASRTRATKQSRDRLVSVADAAMTVGVSPTTVTRRYSGTDYFCRRHAPRHSPHGAIRHDGVSSRRCGLSITLEHAPNTKGGSYESRRTRHSRVARPDNRVGGENRRL